MPGKPDPERGTIRATWEEVFGAPPPPYLSVGFMRKALDYEAQCRKHGGLPAKTRSTLERIAAGEAATSASPPTLRPGAQLVREWNGRTYRVEVLEKGYRMGDRSWASLSAIARHITGAHWSGPRFFGLTDRKGGGT